MLKSLLDARVSGCIALPQLPPVLDLALRQLEFRAGLNIDRYRPPRIALASQDLAWLGNLLRFHLENLR